jgi:hypothetical protein
LTEIPKIPSFENPLVTVLELGKDQRYDFIFKDGSRTEFEQYNAAHKPDLIQPEIHKI